MQMLNIAISHINTLAYIISSIIKTMYVYTFAPIRQKAEETKARYTKITHNDYSNNPRALSDLISIPISNDGGVETSM